MKTKLLSFLCIAGLMLFSTTSSAQTTLAAGDIVVFWNQSDTPDSFAFVTFVDLDPGTGIYFTDCGTDAVGFRMPACTEGAVKYTVPAGGLSIGDIIIWDAGAPGPDFTPYTDTRITGSLAMATSGDQVIVFQDATNAAGGTNAGNTPTFIFANHNASTQFLGVPDDSNETFLPPGLTDMGLPRTAIGLGAGPGVDEEWDNTVFNGSYGPYATVADAKIAVTNPANYSQVNAVTDEPYATNVFFIPNRFTITTLSTEAFDIKSVKMYPNPANNYISISNADNINEVRIYDVTGKEIIKTNLVDNRVDISQLHSGLYLVNIISDEGHVVKKLMKQ